VQIPRAVAAQRAARWLARQVSAEGFIPTPTGTQANLSSTAQTVLALTAAQVGLSHAHAAVTYLEANVDRYVSVEGADGPGQLALLILDAAVSGTDPESFGGTNLVARLLATQQTQGSDAGLFGTEGQLSDESAGTYTQGLALAALAAAGIRHSSESDAAVRWLLIQQCPGGGWTLPDTALNACNGTPSSGAGPDTNSTAMATQGLAAQGALTSAVSSTVTSFLKSAQDADAGWSYHPNSSTTPGAADPNSTALVIQALLAAGISPTGTAFEKHTATPVSALLSFQLTSGGGAGAFYYPPATSTPNIIATYQAVPALEGLSLPWSSKAKA
jgi:hypothetical protein